MGEGLQWHCKIWFNSKMTLNVMSQGKKIDFQEVLTFQDIVKGLKKLKRKNKYSEYDHSDYVKRYLSIADKKENNLKKFLNKYLDDDQKIKESSLLTFFESIKSYSLKPYNALAIEKGSSNPKKFRPLLVPEPEDRLIFDSLLPIYFKILKPYLVKRNLLGLGLVKKQRISDILEGIFNKYIKQGYHFVLTLDYSSFFSLIDRGILIDKLKLDLGNDKLLSILDIVINNEIKNGEQVQKITGVKILENGIPQGLSFSPLLACYYALDIDDIYLNDGNVAGFRYIDDIIIFGKSEADLRSVYEKIEARSKELKMCLHPIGTKTELKNLSTDPIKYLGVEISTNGLRISDEKFEELIDIIKNEIFHINNIEKKEIPLIKKVYFSFIRGWLNHYEKVSSDIPALYQKIDNFLFDSFFKKKRVRKSFYNTNPWIKLIGNKEIKGNFNI